MKSSIDSFDNLLASNDLDAIWLSLNGGYRNAVVDERAQQDLFFGLEVDSNALFSDILNHSLADFSAQLQLSTIDQLVGKAQIHKPPSSAAQNPTKRDVSSAFERHTGQDVAHKRSQKSSQDASEFEKNASNKNKPTHENKLSKAILSFVDTTGKKTHKVDKISPEQAAKELFKRAAKAGKPAEWTKKIVGQTVDTGIKTPLNKDTTNNKPIKKLDATLNDGLDKLNTFNVKKQRPNAEQPSMNKLNRKLDPFNLETTNKDKAPNKDKAIVKTPRHAGTNNERFTNIQAGGTPTNKRDLHPNTSQAQKERMPSLQEKTSTTPNNKQKETSAVSSLAPSSQSGGLRGLATLGKTEAHKNDKIRDNKTIDLSSSQSSASTVINADLSLASSNQVTGTNTTQANNSDFAKVLADEARRAGIDLEKFQP